MYDNLQRFLARAANAQQTQYTAHNRVDHEEEGTDAVLDVKRDAAHATYLEKGVIMGVFQRLVRHKRDINRKFACVKNDREQKCKLIQEEIG